MSDYVNRAEMVDYVKTVATEFAGLTNDMNKAKGLLCALCAFLESRGLMSAADAEEIRENAKDTAAYLDEMSSVRTLERLIDLLDRQEHDQ